MFPMMLQQPQVGQTRFPDMVCPAKERFLVIFTQDLPICSGALILNLPFRQ